MSVVVPACNAAATIGSQVRAILGQACGRPWELVVVDDASTDGTARVADAAGAGDSRYRRVSGARRLGASGARRLGVAHAGGSLLVFCDADDVVAPGWLEALRVASSSFDVVGGFCDDRILNPEVLRRRRPSQPRHGLPVALGGLRYALGANLAIRREAYEAVGGWDATVFHGTDVDLCLRAQMAGWSLGWAPDAVVAYRHRRTWRHLVVQSFRWGWADSQLARRHASVLSGGSGGGRLGPALRRVAAGEDSVVRLWAFAAGRALGALR